MQMSQALLDHLNAAFADPEQDYRTVSVHESVHTSVGVGPPSVPEGPPALTETSERHVSLTVESIVTGKVLIFTLEGPGGALPTKASLIYNGSTFETDDVELITRLDGSVALAAPILVQAALDDLTAPPENQDEGEES